MRALRILLIVVVVLGGLFVAADLVAVHVAQSEAADRLRSSENLDSTPEVSINGFPFLTQVVSGSLDDVEVTVRDYEAATSGTAGDGHVRIDELKAHMRDVEFSGDFGSARARTADGTARISYAELLKAAHVEPVRIAPGVSAKVVGLSDGGKGRIKVTVEATVLGKKLPQPLSVMSTAKVADDVVQVHADALPEIGVPIAENKVREITDFQQRIGSLPAGIRIDRVRAAPDGVHVTVKGSDVRLAG